VHIIIALKRCLQKAESSRAQLMVRRQKALIAAVGGMEKYREILIPDRLMTQLRNQVLARCATLLLAPKQARNLLFRSSLLDIVETTPIEHFLQAQNWPAILRQSRDIIHGYCQRHTCTLRTTVATAMEKLALVQSST
jgi:hypothetical protein